MRGMMQMSSMRRGVERMMSRLVARGVPDARRDVCRAARHQALTNHDDEHAKAVLECKVSACDEVIGDALEVLGKSRRGFVDDRAFRLLDAIRRKGAVEAVAVENEALFSREKDLGHASVARAFAQLSEMEPRLLEVARSAQRQLAAGTTSPKATTRRKCVSSAGLRALVGPGAHHPDPLMRTELAMSIVSQYVAILNGKLPCEMMSESYFCSPKRIVVRSG
jgi:hypothetical protein